MLSVFILVPLTPVHTFISCCRHSSILPCSPGTGAPAVVQALSTASSIEEKMSRFSMVSVKSDLEGKSSTESFALAGYR